MADVGGNGLTVTEKPEETVPFPQLLLPKTLTYPDVEVKLKSTRILLVFIPDTINAPEGNVHVYDVAFGIMGTV